MTVMTNHEHRRTTVVSPGKTHARGPDFDSSGRHTTPFLNISSSSNYIKTQKLKFLNEVQIQKLKLLNEVQHVTISIQK